MNKALSFFKNFLLSPFSFLWELVYLLRRNFYKYGFFQQSHFMVPVISVGNVTFGGTGKTPFTIWLSEEFNRMNKTIMVLTRGYKGKFEKSHGIIQGEEAYKNDPQDYGDEPLLIARKIKKGAVVVGKNRSENLKYYFSNVKPDIVLLDDGFQHLKLYQNLSIVLFDALLPLDQYSVAPLGYLREGMTALKDADCIVISRADQASVEQRQALKSLIKNYLKKETPIAEIQYKPTGLYSPQFKKVYDIEDLRNRKVIALAAIASPESFFRLIESYGAQIVDKVIYPDHYYFTPEDINNILFKATSLGALVIASEKDIVKIRRISLEARILFIDIQVNFLSGEEELKNKLIKELKF
jgi:tetraacyldisaccharide 4'-kinase